MVLLSPRLEAVARHVLPGLPLADIGTDHGYLPVHLVEAGVVPRAVAGDVLPGPLEAARATVGAAGLESQVQLRLGSGLSVLKPGEVATVAICGMGGTLMTELLAAGPLDGVQRLVLQPMGAFETVRHWLADNVWQIIAEEVAREGDKFYVIVVAEPGVMTLTEAEALLGPRLLAEPTSLFLDYVRALLDRARRALAGAKRSSRPEAAARVQALKRWIELLEEVLDGAGTKRGQDCPVHGGVGSPALGGDVG